MFSSFALFEMGYNAYGMMNNMVGGGKRGEGGYKLFNGPNWGRKEMESISSCLLLLLV